MAGRSRRRGRGGRRRGGASPLLASIAVALTLILGAGAVVTALSWGSDDEKGTAMPSQSPSTTGVNLVLLVDPSGSGGGPAAAHKALNVFASALWAHAGAKPTSRGQTTGVPAVQVWVRRVASDSYAAAATVAQVTIPAVPALAARPTASDAAATTEFLREVSGAQNAWAAARRASQLGAARVRALSLPSQDSDIAGAVSASADLLRSASERRVLLVVSDLEQAGTPGQSAGSLKGAEILVAQICVKGPTACVLSRQRFSALMRRLGASKLTYVRPEQLGDVIPSLLEVQS